MYMVIVASVGGNFKCNFKMSNTQLDLGTQIVGK